MPIPAQITRRPDRVGPPTPPPAEAVPPQQRAPGPRRQLQWIFGRAYRLGRWRDHVLIAAAAGYIYEVFQVGSTTHIAVLLRVKVVEETTALSLEAAKQWCAEHAARNTETARR